MFVFLTKYCLITKLLCFTCYMEILSPQDEPFRKYSIGHIRNGHFARTREILAIHSDFTS